jgi:hypothetical protein
VSLVRHWAGLAPDLSLGVAPCPKCGCMVVDTSAGRARHENAVHRERVQLEKLPVTKIVMEYVTSGRRGRMSEDEEVLCGACRAGDCLLCDGGSCRCVCALELDEPRRKWR